MTTTLSPPAATTTTTRNISGHDKQWSTNNFIQGLGGSVKSLIDLYNHDICSTHHSLTLIKQNNALWCHQYGHHQCCSADITNICKNNTVTSANGKYGICTSFNQRQYTPLSKSSNQQLSACKRRHLFRQSRNLSSPPLRRQQQHISQSVNSLPDFLTNQQTNNQSKSTVRKLHLVFEGGQGERMKSSQLNVRIEHSPIKSNNYEQYDNVNTFSNDNQKTFRSTLILNNSRSSFTKLAVPLFPPQQLRDDKQNNGELLKRRSDGRNKTTKRNRINNQLRRTKSIDSNKKLHISSSECSSIPLSIDDDSCIGNSICSESLRPTLQSYESDDSVCGIPKSIQFLCRSYDSMSFLEPTGNVEKVDPKNNSLLTMQKLSHSVHIQQPQLFRRMNLKRSCKSVENVNAKNTYTKSNDCLLIQPPLSTSMLSSYM